MKNTELEIAKVGYSCAINLWTLAVQEVWARFIAMVTGNSIIFIAITSINDDNSILKIILSIIGILMCIAWFVLTKRTVELADYYIISTREIEEKYFKKYFKTVTRGKKFTDGELVHFNNLNDPNKKQLSLITRKCHSRCIAYFIIFLFFLSYIFISVASLKLKICGFQF